MPPRDAFERFPASKYGFLQAGDALEGTEYGRQSRSAYGRGFVHHAYNKAKEQKSRKSQPGDSNASFVVIWLLDMLCWSCSFISWGTWRASYHISSLRVGNAFSLEWRDGASFTLSVHPCRLRSFNSLSQTVPRSIVTLIVQKPILRATYWGFAGGLKPPNALLVSTKDRRLLCAMSQNPGVPEDVMKVLRDQTLNRKPCTGGMYHGL